jgi:arsenate reductase
MKTVIFACVHNAGRSQMAAAFFNALVDPTKARGVSAGTQPGERVHPDELAQGSEWLITMGCGEACPHVPGLKRDDWPLEDPKGKPVERVRQIRDEVRSRVSAFLSREGWAR